MKLLKRVLSLTLVFALLALSCVSLASCKDDGKYTIGICQLVTHDALDAATKGFKDAVIEALGEENVTFIEQNAGNDIPLCTTIANDFVSKNVDLIMANATSALQAAASATADIPVLGTSVTEYGVALGIKDFDGLVGGNISGTSDLAPLDEQAQMILDLCPNAEKVGLLYCSAEPNSMYQSKLAQAELDKANIAWEEYTAADSNEVQSVVTKAVSECDVLYIPTDNTMANNTEIIKNVAVPAGVPVIAGEEGICSGCGVATLSISYYDLGVKAAEMAYEILVNGADPAEMPIEYVSEGITEKYNAEIAEALQIAIPEGMVAIGE